MARLSSAIVLVILSLLSLLIIVDSQSTCQLNNVGSFSSYDQAHSCLTLLPYNNYIVKTTIDTLRKSLSLFTFLELAAAPPMNSGLTGLIPVSLEDQLNRISNTVYNNDFEFQNDLAQVYSYMNDAHSLYFRPNNYAALTSYQPFTLIQYIDPTENNAQKIIIDPHFIPGIKQYYLDTFGIDLTTYIGATVLAIEAEDALSYLKNWSFYHCSLAKDASSRFNFAFTRFLPTADNGAEVRFDPGMFQARRGLYGQFPTTKTVTYSLLLADKVTKVNVSFQWVVATTKQINSDKDWKALYYANPNPDESSVKTNSIMSSLSPLQRINRFSNNHELLHETITVPRERSVMAASIKDNDRVYYSLGAFDIYSSWLLGSSNNATMAIWLKNMEPNQNTLDKFNRVIEKSFQKAIDLGVQNLIIDLTDNGGGFENTLK